MLHFYWDESVNTKGRLFPVADVKARLEWALGHWVAHWAAACKVIYWQPITILVGPPDNLRHYHP